MWRHAGKGAIARISTWKFYKMREQAIFENKALQLLEKRAEVGNSRNWTFPSIRSTKPSGWLSQKSLATLQQHQKMCRHVILEGGGVRRRQNDFWKSALPRKLMLRDDSYKKTASCYDLEKAKRGIMYVYLFAFGVSIFVFVACDDGSWLYWMDIRTNRKYRFNVTAHIRTHTQRHTSLTCPSRCWVCPTPGPCSTRRPAGQNPTACSPSPGSVAYAVAPIHQHGQVKNLK